MLVFFGWIASSGRGSGMTVSELIGKLLAFPPDARVIANRDDTCTGMELGKTFYYNDVDRELNLNADRGASLCNTCDDGY